MTTNPPAEAGQKLDRFLRRKEVEATTGLSTSALYALIRAGSFPQPRKLGPLTTAWFESEVAAWMAARPVGLCVPPHQRNKQVA